MKSTDEQFTARDFLATMAMVGLLARPESTLHLHEIAKLAYQQADLMIAESQKKRPG